MILYLNERFIRITFYCQWIQSKYDTFIADAGGLDVANVRKAYFNGVDIAILNIVTATDPNN